MQSENIFVALWTTLFREMCTYKNPCYPPKSVGHSVLVAGLIFTISPLRFHHPDKNSKKWICHKNDLSCRNGVKHPIINTFCCLYPNNDEYNEKQYLQIGPKLQDTNLYFLWHIGLDNAISAVGDIDNIQVILVFILPITNR